MEKLYEIFGNSSGICTDSRIVKAGNLYFSLRGEKFDGNTFALSALERGAVAAVVDSPSAGRHKDFVVVDNALETLQQLATYHRKKNGLTVLAITGSNGKTTTRELVTRVLSRRYRVHSTAGNLNNHIGLPLSLLGIQSNHEFGIMEMGANHPGEIHELCDIACPDYGLITNIGKAHLEGFGGFEGVIRTKTEMYEYLRHSGGLVFVNGEDPLLTSKSEGMRREYYQHSNARVSGEIISDQDVLEIELRLDGVPFRLKTQIPGAYNLPNILAAACVGLYFRVSAQSICDAITSFVPENQRSQIIESGKNRILMDAYNANPSSMEAALNSFVRQSFAPKAFILGEMLELGRESELEHRNLLEKVSETGIEKVFYVGKGFSGLCPPKGTLWFENTEMLRKHLLDNPLKGFFILLKGSRGNRLELLLDVL